MFFFKKKINVLNYTEISGKVTICNGKCGELLYIILVALHVPAFCFAVHSNSREETD